MVWVTVRTACCFPGRLCQISTVTPCDSDHVSASRWIVLKSSELYIYRRKLVKTGSSCCVRSICILKKLQHSHDLKAGLAIWQTDAPSVWNISLPFPWNLFSDVQTVSLWERKAAVFTCAGWQSHQAGLGSGWDGGRKRWQRVRAQPERWQQQPEVRGGGDVGWCLQGKAAHSTTTPLRDVCECCWCGAPELFAVGLCGWWQLSFFPVSVNPCLKLNVLLAWWSSFLHVHDGAVWL